MTSFIYVSNRETDLLNSEQDGSEENPFTNLRDALTKADELAAPYSTYNV